MRRIFGFFLIVSFFIIFLGISCISCVNNFRRTIIVPAVSEYVSYSSSIVMLSSMVVIDGETIGSIATGFAISSDHLVTAGHYCQTIKELEEGGLISGKIQVTGANQDGSLFDIGEAEILVKSDKYDLCILILKDHGLPPLKLADSVEDVRTEDKIIVVGAPATFFPVRREGHVIAISANDISDKFSSLMLLSIDIQKGSSGSPVIWNGEVIGVIVILPPGLHNGALAENVNSLNEFLVESLKE